MTRANIVPADGVVIGGGLIGLVAAAALARRGLSVALIDAGRCGAHASGLNAGGVRTVGRDPAELPLALEAMRAWDDAPERIGPGAEFERRGHLILAETEAEAAALDRRFSEARAAGVPDVARLSAAEARRLVPGLADTVVGALYAPRDGMADPAQAVAAALARARALGVRVVENAPVLDLRREGEGFHVETETWRFPSGAVVNAAGAWGAELAERLGDALPLVVEAPMAQRTAPVEMAIEPVLQTVGRKLTLKRRRDGRLLIGGGHRGMANARARRAEAVEAEAEANRATAESLLPRLGRLRAEAVWAGLEGYAPDRLPILGRGSAPGVVHAFGFSGHGFQLAPAVGPLVAELLLDQTAPALAQPFAPARFAVRSAGAGSAPGVRVG